MFRFKKKEKIEIPLEVPKHIGIIMDGNGRWAKKRMQPRVFGHKKTDDWKQFFQNDNRPLRGEEPDFAEEGWAKRSKRKK